MSKTILVGFTKNVGQFTSDKTGEVINYSNRELFCITNIGEDRKKYFGYTPFKEKLKLSDLAASLGCAESDTAVDQKLDTLINKPIEFERAPRNGEFQVIGFKVITT